METFPVALDWFNAIMVPVILFLNYREAKKLEHDEATIERRGKPLIAVGIIVLGLAIGCYTVCKYILNLASPSLLTINALKWLVFVACIAGLIEYFVKRRKRLQVSKSQ